MMMQINEATVDIDLKKHARDIRLLILEMITKAKASHIGSCYSIIEILVSLYGRGLRSEGPSNPLNDPKFVDYVLISKGHASAACYATLAYYGYFNLEELSTYCADGSRLAGHVTKTVPGVHFSSGALGHALPVACGVAIAAPENKIYVVASDGECNEGSTWEAALFAGAKKLKNLTLIIDYNKIQSFGSVDEIMPLEPLADKWRAFHWEVVEVDGHDTNALAKAYSSSSSAQPKVIIAHTVKGKGVSFMENNLKWHYSSPNAEEFEIAKQEILSEK
jgi:transketolase